MSDEEPAGLRKLRKWADGVGGNWHAEPATGGHYRLLYGDDRKVLYVHDTRKGVSGFVDCARTEDMDELSRFGRSPSGYNHVKRGAGFAFHDLEGLLEWCARVAPARVVSLPKLMRSRTGPRR